MTQTQQFQCGTCNCEFKTHQELMEHEKIHSRGTTYYYCTCGARFTDTSEYLDHSQSHQR